MTHHDARNDQPGHIIERTDAVEPLYLSEKVGRDFAAGPYGGWAIERCKATVYTEQQAQALVEGPLGHIAPFCKVVAK